MPYNPIVETRAYTNEEMGLPNFGEAIKQGMLASQRAAQTAVTPRALSEKLLNAHLENSKQRILNQYLGTHQGLQNRLLEAQILKQEHENDPMYYITQLRNAAKGYTNPTSMNDYSNDNGDVASSLPNKTTVDEYGTQPSASDYKDAQNAPMEFGNETQQPDFNQQRDNQHMPKRTFGGLDVDVIRANPELWPLAKKAGFDPSVQTQEEKDKKALELFKQKEAIRQTNKNGDIATNTTLTQNQKSLQAIDNVVPMLDEIVKHPEQVYGILDFSRSKEATYNSKTAAMVDMLIAAQNLPSTLESLHLVESQVKRQRGETTTSYVARLKDFTNDLLKRREMAAKVLSSKKVDTKTPVREDFSKLTDEQLHAIAGGA